MLTQSVPSGPCVSKASAPKSESRTSEVYRSLDRRSRVPSARRDARGYVMRMGRPVGSRRENDVERELEAAVAGAFARALTGRGRIVLAVSGGIDSMVLLDLAASALPADQLIVATFDHGTGPAASAAATLVVRRASTLGVRCVAGRRAASGNPEDCSEAALRTARWEFLRRVAGEWNGVVATAHTRDDQIETVLMRVMRGAGARGLAGLYAASPTIRPLLAFRRAQIAAYAASRRMRWVEDPSNASRRYLRNRVRHDLLPALATVNPAIDRELLEISARADEWRRSVEALAAPMVPAASADGVDVDAAELRQFGPAGLGLLWPAFAARAGVTLDRRGTRRLVEFTANARVGSRVQVAGGWQVVRSRDAFQLRPSAPNTPTPAELCASAELRWGRWLFRPVASKSGAERRSGDSWSIRLPRASAATIRAWRPGDVLAARSGGTPRKVKRLLSSAGVTGHDRAGWPVVLVDNEIVWIPGVVRARRLAAAEMAHSAAQTADSGLTFVCEQLSR
jgi:tRNA(Ile)-lysidine synthase